MQYLKLNKYAKKNIKQGVHIIEPNKKELERQIKAGYHYIAFSMDTRMMWYSAKLLLKNDE